MPHLFFTFIKASSVRALSITLAPKSQYPCASIAPMPLEPPVIRTFFPATQKSPRDKIDEAMAILLEKKGSEKKKKLI